MTLPAQFDMRAMVTLSSTIRHHSWALCSSSFGSIVAVNELMLAFFFPVYLLGLIGTIRDGNLFSYHCILRQEEEKVNANSRKGTHTKQDD